MNTLKTPIINAEGDYLIPLTHGLFAIVDQQDYIELSPLYWRAVKSSCGWYAKTRTCSRCGKKDLFMHRLIMQTPPGYDCHHINGNTLDNRKSNLQNLTTALHSNLHSMRKISKKF